MEIEKDKIKKIYDYLSESTTIEGSGLDGIIVFGRSDPLIAKSAGTLNKIIHSDYFLFTGGIGKDSGYLTTLKLPESKWLAALSHIIYEIPQEKIYIEPNSTNGGECCRFSIDTIVKNNLSHDSLGLLIHPTSLRRIYAVMQTIASEKNFNVKFDYSRFPSEYSFNPENPVDQKEAVAELLRLADWPEKGWCAKQEDLPEDLVGYARKVKTSF